MKSVSIVLKGYPRLSETFIAQEILGLQERGLSLQLISLRFPTDKSIHPVHEKISAPVNYLPEYLYQEPLRTIKAWRQVRKLPGYKKARVIWLKDLRRDLTSNRIRRFGQAIVLAHELAKDTGFIYAHFLHTPASVARYAAIIRNLDWGCSAHAKDIWTSPEWEKAEKLADMNWLVTCTRTNVEHLRELTDRSEKVELVYHGLDFSRFGEPRHEYSRRRGDQPDDPVIIFSVGRAVDKKGYDILLNALSLLPDALHWRFVHIGGGELTRELKKHGRELGLDARIEWLGARPQGDVLENYIRADIFALACRVADNGDRDGLPNVLMEAQSQGVACLTTRVSAIPELIIDGETGLLVEQNDAEALSETLKQLITAPDLRRKLGEAGEKRVRSEFGHDKGIDEVARRLRESLK